MENKNDKILDEVAFSKDRLDKKLERDLSKATYNPVSNNRTPGSDAIFISDPGEVKKRLTGALGVAIGNNTVKSMADKSIKRFPIIASDDLSPETIVMLKSYIEEQYCNDLSLLISNMIIDINKFKANSPDGNIALQALDVVSGTDFSKQRVARQAMTGNLLTNDVFKNNPIYQLLRTESFTELGLTTGDKGVDALLDEAAIMPSDVVESYITEAMNSYEQQGMLNEYLLGPFDETEGNIHSLEDFKNAIESGVARDTVVEITAGELNKLYTMVNARDKNTGAPKSTPTTETSRRYDILQKAYTAASGSNKERCKADLLSFIATTLWIDMGGLKTLGVEKLILDIDNSTYREPGTQPYNRNHKEPEKSSKDVQYHPNDNVYNTFHNDAVTKRNSVILGLDSENQKIAKKYMDTLLDPLKYIDNNGNDRTGVQQKHELITLADCLALPENDIIRDRLNKALYLLSSSRIAGHEFISYCCDRLGLPIGPKIRQTIINRYPVEALYINGRSLEIDKKIDKSNLKRLGLDAKNINDTADNIESAINNNIVIDKDIYKLADEIYEFKISKAMAHVGVGTAVGMSGGAIAALFGCPFILPVILGGAAVGGLGGLITYLITRKKKTINGYSKMTMGWERVEALINNLDQNYLNIKRDYKNMYDYRNVEVNRMYKQLNPDKPAEVKLYNEFTNKLNSVYNSNVTVKKLREELEVRQANENLLDENYSVESTGYRINTKALNKFAEELIEYSKDTPGKYNYDLTSFNYKIGLFTEALQEYPKLSEAFHIFKSNKDKNKPVNIVISNKAPIQYEVRDVNYVNKSLEPVLVPEFTARDTRAYGSVEYDRKVIRDRRYNEPLFITVKFKTRFADDKFKDSELTAVIGVLGVVTTIPSDEMAIILKDNAGVDIENPVVNLVGDDASASVKSTLANVLQAFGKNSLYGKLDKSGTIWKNLSKVSQLALSNKLAGKTSNEISNAHIIFSDREINLLKTDCNVDYLKNVKLTEKLIKKYSASEVIICNDVTERAYICDDIERISYDVVPYSALRSKSSQDQTQAVLNQISRTRL